MVEELILRMVLANVRKLDRVKIPHEGNKRWREAWKDLMQFHPVRYDESIRGAKLLRIVSCELVINCCSWGVSWRLWLKMVGLGSGAGTKCLNFCNEKQDKWERWNKWVDYCILWPGMWETLMLNWCWAETRVSLRMNCIISRQWVHPLLMMSTTALLLE